MLEGTSCHWGEGQPGQEVGLKQGMRSKIQMGEHTGSQEFE